MVLVVYLCLYIFGINLGLLVFYSILGKGLQLLVPLHTFECHICTECSQRIRAIEAAVSNGSLLNTFKTPEVMNQFDPNISFSDPYWSSKFWRSAQYHLGHQFPINKCSNNSKQSSVLCQQI